eukprot:GHVS01089729.1.p1 GENE.GHVS01089729.1~~GHVS01089729.1.p1  ORF type:complete len:212 (+),score=35.85 GHVS01089729.1:695-1330(+)
MGGPGKQYVMADIVAYKMENRQDHYLVAWQGYSQNDNSWEPRKNIISPNEPTIAKMKRLKRRWKSKYGENSGETSVTPPAPCTPGVKQQPAISPPTPLPTKRRKKTQEHNSTATDDTQESASSKRRQEEEAELNTVGQSEPLQHHAVNVKLIKPVNGELGVHAVGDGFPPEEDRFFMPLATFRELCPQPLISFFLKNLKFINENEKGKKEL